MIDYKNITIPQSSTAFSKKEKAKIAAMATTLVVAIVLTVVTFSLLGLMMNTPAPQLPPVLAEGVAK